MPIRRHRTRPNASRPLLGLALACLLPLHAAPALAAPLDPPPGVVAGPCVEGICEYRLGNGLRVLLFPDASKPTVTVNIAYGVGSVNENYGETGMAHLLEHLMFKGTPDHPDIPAEMKRRGIAKNATTSLERTNYYGSFPANDATLDWLLGLEADRMVNSSIDRADLGSEMTVVRNEMERGENNPGAVMFQRLRSTAFLWHNYGHATIGARADVEHVPIERLQAFYKRWYRPDNATLIVAGRIDPAATLARVKARFAGIPRPATPLPVAWTADPTQDGEREVTVRRSGDMRLVAAGYHVPAATHPDSAALAVLMDVLGDTPGGRLHEALVDGRLAAGTGTSLDTLRDSGLAAVLLVAPRDADIEKAEATLLAQVEDIARHPVTDDEVARAKQRIANGYEQNFNNVNAVAMALTESVAAGDWRLYFLRRDSIAAVDADDVNRVARAYFKRSNRTLARFVPTDVPDRAEIPAAPTAAERLAGYVGRQAIDAGESFDPTPARIDARTETFTLGEGLKVSLLPKDTRGDVVTVNATFRYGDASSLRGREVGALAGAMLMRGSTTLSRQQIADRFEALRTTGGVSGGLQSAGLTLQSRRDTVGEALALAADILRHPAFPESEFEQFRLQAITGLEASLKEPGPVASNALAAHFDPWPEGHPLHQQSTAESLAMIRAATLDELKAFHRDFYGTSEGEIAVVGDFDPVAMKAELERLFVGWTSKHPYAPIATRFTRVGPVDERLQVADKANAVLVARSNLSLNEDDADYPALLVANQVLGGDPLKARLGDRLRQQDGLTYGIGSGLRADASIEGRDDAGYLVIQASAAPANVDRLELGIREELQRLVRDGITADELEDTVEALRVEREQALAADGNLVGILGRNLYLGRTMAWSARLDARLQALGVDEVNAAIRRHLDPDALSVFSAGDFGASGGAVGAPAQDAAR
ncbi:pitrilysin family protein [Marilutibacter aestuarii]